MSPHFSESGVRSREPARELAHMSRLSIAWSGRSALSIVEGYRLCVRSLIYIGMVLHRICALVFLGVSALATTHAGDVDADRDGLPDAFEQAMLRKFVPKFHISRNDCDVAPAEFEPVVSQPKLKARNGTIYGHVLPVQRPDAAGVWIEIHYFHLWANDCGQNGHPLDVESVSALLRAENNDWRPESWQATHWYAAAHEGTLCDMNNAATAAALASFHHGPDVWVSKDKHATFLSKELCTRGCGKDECENTTPLQVAALINLGELGASLSGAEWLTSPSWPLASKMTPDFTESVMARIPTGNGPDVVPAREIARGTRTVIKIAGSTYASLAEANSSTGAALASGLEGGTLGIDVAANSVGKSAKRTHASLQSTLTVTRNSLRNAFRWVSAR